VFVYCTTTTSSLGGMAQWGLDSGRALMDTYRAVALSGADGRSRERLRFGLPFQRWVGGKRWR
jgi:hypothetical protein